ncbi:MAG: efflux RND transporter periplasmic adaptor subunit [Betaproteobacteria bacterium]|nr:efflux RND transporter periplasmic adaptor subunit [Betaproteobacteria bacterium]
MRIAPLIALPVLLFLAACNKPEGGAGKGMGGNMPPPEVEVVTVGAHDVARTADVPGRLAAVRRAEVRARVEGILEKREYAEGADVKKDAVLFRIDPRTLAANVDSAAAALARAKADARIAVQTLERAQTLIRDKAVSQQEVDQATARRAQSEADVLAAEAALTRARIDLSYATVTAPISGRIGRALVTEGALVGKGEATQLAVIEQMDPIWVNFSQSSADFLRLREALRSGKAKKVNAPVRLLLEDGREYGPAGKLLFSDLAVDPATGSVGLRAEFPNPQRDLLPGQFVTVRLPTALASQVITVPQRAVQASPQGQVVMVVSPEGKLAPQPVRTGGLAGSDWIISEGLKGGEKVVVNGLQKARPGMPVKPVAAH